MISDLQNSAKFNVYAIQNEIHFSLYFTRIKAQK